jgi:hypothetical protein
MRLLGIEQDAFGSGSFTGVDVSGDADIAHFGYVDIPGQILLPTEMSESFVGFRHFVSIFLLLDRGTFIASGSHKLRG